MGAETGFDEGVLHRFRVEHGHLALRHVDREGLGRRMIRALLAEGGVVVTAHIGRKPHPALPVEHAVVVVSLLRPDLLHSPVRRGRQRLVERRGVERRPERLGHAVIQDRHLEERNLMRLRVEDRDVVARVFGRTEQRAVGIDGGIAAIRRDQVVEEGLFRAPFPRGNDDVTLDARRPLRLLLGQRARGDAVGPLTEVLERDAAQLGREPGHHE